MPGPPSKQETAQGSPSSAPSSALPSPTVCAQLSSGDRTWPGDCSPKHPTQPQSNPPAPASAVPDKASHSSTTEDCRSSAQSAAQSHTHAAAPAPPVSSTPSTPASPARHPPYRP